MTNAPQSILKAPLMRYHKGMNDDADKRQMTVLEACRIAGVVEPMVYLAHTMAGINMQKHDSRLYEIVQKIDLADRRPTADEWDDLKYIILESGLYRKERVTLAQSIQASEEMMEYLHPKLSRATVESVSSGPQVVTPLTPEEVETFEDWVLNFL